MSRQHRPDPFESIVELTAAAVSRRPPRDFVYEPAGPSVLYRLAEFLHRVRLPRLAADVDAANEPDIHDSKLLQRYY